METGLVLLIAVGCFAVGITPWAWKVASEHDQRFPSPTVVVSWRAVVIALAAIVAAGGYYARFTDKGLSAEAFGSLLAAAFVLFGTKYAADNLTELSKANTAEYSSNLQLSVTAPLAEGRRSLIIKVTNAGRGAALEVRVVRWRMDPQEYWIPYRLPEIGSVIAPLESEQSTTDYDGELQFAFFFLPRSVFEVSEDDGKGNRVRRFFDVGQTDSLGFAPITPSLEMPSFEPKQLAIAKDIIDGCAALNVQIRPEQIAVEISGHQLSVSLLLSNGIPATTPKCDPSNSVEWIAERAIQRAVRFSQVRMFDTEEEEEPY